MKRVALCLGLTLVLVLSMSLPAMGATQGPPDLEAPINLKGELKFDDVGVPYFELTLTVPDSVKKINEHLMDDMEYYKGICCDPVEIALDYKYGDYDWNEGPSMTGEFNTLLAYYLDVGRIHYYLYDKGGWDETVIAEETYQFRVRFFISWGPIDDWMNKTTKSKDSNIVTIGNPGYSSRLFGANRTETAIAVSQKGWPDGANAVILTRNDNYPDALTGTPLAKKLDAPILFTNSTKLTPATETEIARLKPRTVIILGGTGAVAEGIENYLRIKYKMVRRLGGKDRFETGQLIAQDLGYKGKAVITTGMDFHDALIAAPMAAYNNMPILLTTAKAVPQFTKDALTFVNPTEITVVGNTTSVPETVFAELNNATRISGKDIYETSVLVAEHFKANANQIFLATGKDFPDALSGSGLAAKYNSPILFVGDPLSSHVWKYLSRRTVLNPTIHLLGGEAAISPEIKEAVDKIFSR